MTAFILTIEGLFLVLAIFAEVMDRWACGPGPAQPERVFPNCFVE